MSDVSNLLVGLSSLIWPVIIFYLIIRFSGPIKDIIHTAKTRGFTIKVGGTELSFEEAAKQQLVQINDLQEQLVRISHELEELKAAQKGEAPRTDTVGPNIRRILWVDDHPSNNASIVSHLSNLGIVVETALTTQEGLKRFHADQYNLVISDMGRNEDGIENPDAGIDLAKSIRGYDKDLPIIIFCSRRAKQRFEEEAIAAGVTTVTNSSVMLLSEIARAGGFNSNTVVVH